MSGVATRFAMGVLALTIAAAMIGCASHAAAESLQTRTAADDAFELERAFAPGREILDGVDPTNSAGEWRLGDQILFGMRFIDGDTTTVRFVRLELLMSDLDPEQAVDIRVADANTRDATAIGDAMRLAASGESKPPTGFERFAPTKWDYKTSFRDELGKQRSISIESRSALFRLFVYDETGKLIEKHYTFGPESYLREGLIEYIALAKPVLERLPSGSKLPRHKFSDDQLSRLLRGGVSVFAIGRVLWFTPQLMPIIKRMVAMPPIWSIVVNLGVKFSTELRVMEVSDAAAEIPGVTDRGGARQVPFVIRMNERPALRLRMTAMPPLPPLHLCGGIVAMDATHLEHPERRLAARLLAARRAR